MFKNTVWRYSNHLTYYRSEGGVFDKVYLLHIDSLAIVKSLKQNSDISKFKSRQIRCLLQFLKYISRRLFKWSK